MDLVIFFDGGKEFGAIYDIWNRVKRLLDESGIRWAEVYPEYSFDYCFCEKQVNTKNGEEKVGYSWCGGQCRWMTELKTRAINKYYKEHFSKDDMIIEYVGIAADELHRVKIPKRGGNTIQKYPLVEWGYSENDCFVGCYKAGFDWKEPDTDVELYQILDRVSCWCCSNKNLDELRNIYHNLPGYWEKLKEMQSKTELPFKKYGSIFELEERFKQEDAEKEKKTAKKETKATKKKKESNSYKQISMFDEEN